MRSLLARLRFPFAATTAGAPSALALLFAAVLAFSPAASAAESADQFLQQFGKEALGQLTEDGLSEEQRRDRFETLLSQGFDVPAIGQFVVARYWRAASEAERAEFIDVFREYLTQRFLPLFSAYKGEAFDTQPARPTDREDLVWVPLSLDQANGESVKTEWLLKAADDGAYKILDIKAEGTSMAITLRDEYASVIRREGSLGGLTQEIKRLLAQGAFTPKKS